MPKQHLRDVLRELHQELEHTDAVDAEAETLLREVLGDIRSALREPATDVAPRTLAERLSENLDHFEAHHARLALSIRRLMDALGRL